MPQRISSINNRAEDILGLKKENILGKKVSEIFKEDISGIIDLALNNRRVVDNKEVERVGKDGKIVTLGISSSFLESYDRNVAGVIITIQDLTESKKTEELIRRMDRLSSLGQLSAGIAHEIRNPLASINFNVQMLSRKLDMDDRTKSIMDDTIEGVDRLNRVIKAMLDFTRPSIPSLQNGILNNVIVDSVSLINIQLKKRNVDIRTELTEDIPEMVFDPLQMQQVFINLMINAMEAMPEGGTIKVKSMVTNDDKGNDNRLSVYITDNGIGIPPENLPKVFDPFFTTRPDGTGLGLSITHKILEQHNAFIDIVSKENEGTTFVLSFPINSDAERGRYVSI